MDDTDSTPTFEPLGDHGEDADPLDSCATCNSCLDEPGRWYPTHARESGDELALFAFCDGACKREFLAS